MKLKTLFAVPLAVVLVAASAYATSQAPDRLVYAGDTLKLFTNPLEDFYKDRQSARPKFLSAPNTFNSANSRGYVATWAIIDKKLYLTNIESWLCGFDPAVDRGCRKLTLEALFDKQVSGGKVLADWYTGRLRVPDGKELQYVHGGYASLYERDIFFDVKGGDVADPIVVDNTKRPIPSELELIQAELERLKRIKAEDKPWSHPLEAVSSTTLDFIIAGRGWGSVTIGAKRAVVEKLLGKGEGDEGHKALKGVYFREYPDKGVQVSYSHSHDKVEAIFFYNSARRYESFTTPLVMTDKGIDWKASPEDVIKAHGKPKEDHKGEGWRRIVFEGIDFRFENGKMVRIGIPGR